MSVIETLITDRTNADLMNDTDRAYNSYIDLNRIEEACAYVAVEIGLSIDAKTDWAMTDFRTASEMERIRSNLTLIRTTMHKTKTPAVPVTVNFSSIYQANDIEQIIYDADALFQNVISGIRRLSFVCGRKLLGNRR